ncbi:MAG: bifunctional serine/threonine-protein kinase/formylglycine-generating enzyme family protein [Calothrix sp. MO_192.B10]|nr:bifunctional serine/threonine-protein kinase/formylglycine-generating enzyme family protein [Calothrix sp. MO_192.B10]
MILAGRYEIIRQLGGGGFAITYLAKDTMQPSQPICVVKQLRPNHTHPRIVEFFEKEAAILERLGKHPQIPQLLAHFRENGNLYIVQEFIEGQDLSKEMQPGKRLSEGYVTRLLEEVLKVLSFVHKQGVIHRDIKPQNLMRRRQDGKIFLIDFGVVKEIASLMFNSQGEIVSSISIGTPGYMPTEQGMGKPRLASDIYALGITGIQALVGTLPSNLEEDPQTGEIVWQDKVHISEHLAKVLTTMVRRHHSLRYYSAKEALQALTPPPPKPEPQPQSQPRDWSRRRILQTAGLMGGGFAVAVFGREILQAFSDGNSTSITTPSPNQPASPIVTPTTKQTPTLSPTPGFSLKTFDFETVTINNKGNITNRRNLKAKYFTEDLGNGVTLEMVQIPGGSFMMGSPAGEKGRDDNESPQHKVTVQPFYMGRYEVTQAQYQAIMGNNPSRFQGEKRPVEQVSWNNVVVFCEKLSQKTGRTYRLPSEAEWEYAARAGTTTPFYYGETITSDLVNYGNNNNGTTEVGRFPPNAFGLYDMHGNVFECCQDHWHDDYNGAPTDGRAWIGNSNDSSRRVLRGGSWLHPSDIARSARRGWWHRYNNSHHSGFRVVLSGNI